MSDAEEQGAEQHRTGIPRDLPDQEAGDGAGDAAEPGDAYGAPGDEEELPDTDEAGSGPRRSGAAPPEDERPSPEPDEPTD